MNIERSAITGLVLAGGRGSRMGGIDKGLQLHLGMPMAQRATGAPLAAGRPRDDQCEPQPRRYEAMGVPVWTDASPAYLGPLAGVLAGLARCETPYLATVPCDSPDFPPDLVARLARGLADAGAEIAVAATREHGELRLQPVFCLLSASLHASLAAFLGSGERQVERWIREHRCAEVLFDDAPAFFNANTLADLERLQTSPPYNRPQHP